MKTWMQFGRILTETGIRTWLLQAGEISITEKMSGWFQGYTSMKKGIV